MRFKTWLIEENVISIPTPKLWGWRPKLSEALEDIRLQKLSFSQGKPVIVSRLDNPRGHFYVIDGYHRVIEAILEGHATIAAEIDPYTPRIERTGGAHKNMLDDKVRFVDEVQRPPGMGM